MVLSLMVFDFKKGKIFAKSVSIFQNNLCPWFVQVFVVHYKIRNLNVELREVGIIYGGVLNFSCFLSGTITDYFCNTDESVNNDSF